MTANKIYIITLGVGLKCPCKIHLNTQWEGRGGGQVIIQGLLDGVCFYFVQNLGGILPPPPSFRRPCKVQCTCGIFCGFGPSVSGAIVYWFLQA